VVEGEAPALGLDRRHALAQRRQHAARLGEAALGGIGRGARLRHGGGQGGQPLASLLALGFGRAERLLDWWPRCARRSSASPTATSSATRSPAARCGSESPIPKSPAARRLPGRCARELRLAFAEAGELVEGAVDLAFEEDGPLVVVDYKSDAIAPEQALAQAAHHAPQLRLYARGLAVASGLEVRERLVLFTSLAQAVPV